MKFLLIAIGTRGDVEPFLTLGNLLKTNGEEVACCFPEQFRHLVEEEGFEFFSLGPEFLDMVESEEGKIVMGGAQVSPWRRLKAFYALYKGSIRINKQMFFMQKDFIESWQADKIVFHPKTVYPYVLNTKNKCVLSPVPFLIHEVKGRPHLGIKYNLGSFLNHQIYKLLNKAIVKNIKQIAKEYLKEQNISGKQILDNIVDTDIMYMISPSLFARPEYWPEHAQVFGYRERKKTNNWEASDELVNFLSRHEKPIVLSFGSMNNGRPQQTTKLFLEILQSLNIPAVIITSFGGLEVPEEYNKDLFLFSSDIPYDWLFSRVYGVIHHGGAGTCHMVIKNGCASLVIPHIIDQFMWNDLLAEKGVGPKGISIRKLKKQKLKILIEDFYENEKYKRSAEQLGAQIKKEDFSQEILEFLIPES